MIKHEIEIGTLIESPDWIAFFGNHLASKERVQEFFPQYQFSFLKQVHGQSILETTDDNYSNIREADAHYTSTPNLAISISTADCMPVMIIDPDISYAAAIHVGWRGIAKSIVPLTIEQLSLKGSSINNLKIIIGPHIGFDSFEVEHDVAKEILSSINQIKSGFHLVNSSDYQKIISHDKCKLNLFKIVTQQIFETGCSKQQILQIDMDTFTNDNFHSFRRDGKTAGRQISFITLTT